jgi:hypothetical protein
MRNLIRILAALAFFSCGAQAQIAQTGAGRGTPGGAAAYVGPGDIVSGAVVWYGLRAYSAAYAAVTGNAVGLVDQAGANAITIKVKTDGSLDVASISTWVTAHTVTTIKVATLFDQSGNGVDLTQGTVANMPTLVLASLGSLPTLVFTAASSQQVSNASGTVILANPYTLSLVMNRTSDSGLFGYDGFRNQQSGSSSVVRIFDFTNVLDATASDGSWHAAQAIDTGAGANASQWYIDGASTTGTLSVLASRLGFQVVVGSASGAANFFDGSLAELGFWNADFSSPDKRSNMNANQHTYWGF